MNLRPKKIIRLFYDAGYHTVHDDGVEHAGYLAFLALLSIFPALIFLCAIAAHLGKAEYGTDLINQIYMLLPKNVYSELEPVITGILSGPPPGLITIAIIGILWTASGALEGVRTILNRAYRVENPPHYLFRRILSILQFIVLIFILIIAMFFLTVIPYIIGTVEKSFNIVNIPDLSSLRYLASAVALFIVVATSYYVLPNIRQKFSSVLIGAKICVALWLIIIEIFSNYVTYYHRINNVYGSLAGVVLTLVFFYLLSIVYIYGAEFNYFLEKALGHKIIEKEPAEKI